MLASHFLRTPDISDGCLFYIEVGGSWKPLLYKDLLSFFKNCVRCLGLALEEVGLHWRSGAVFLQSINVSLVDIMDARDCLSTCNCCILSLHCHASKLLKRE